MIESILAIPLIIGVYVFGALMYIVALGFIGLLSVIVQHIAFVWGQEESFWYRRNGNTLRDFGYVVLCILFPLFMVLVSSVPLYRGLFPTKVDTPPILIVREEVRKYELTALTSPKHVYASLEDDITGYKYSERYVAKHCARHSENKIGDKYNLNVRYMKQGDKTWIDFYNLNAAFC